MEKAVAKPLVKEFVDKLGLKQTSGIALGQRKRMIIYPCRSGTLLNCALIVYTGDQLGPESSWNSAGRLEDLMKALEGADDRIKEFVRCAEDVKNWTLATRDPPPTFVKGRLALLGDAAHPMLPRKCFRPLDPGLTWVNFFWSGSPRTNVQTDQGQGGAQAIEDAATLGALFRSDTRPEQVSDLLDMYNQIRYNHTVSICITSRVDQKSSVDVLAENLDVLRRFVPDGTRPENPALVAWSSYPAQEAERLLALRRGEKAF